MPFYRYRQNNSGGSFHYDETAGIGVTVIVEATDADHANSRAEAIGLYWDGCDAGRDCRCCGDRWYSQWSFNGQDEGDAVPTDYDTEVREGMTYQELHPDGPWSRWRMTPEEQADAFVHYLDGRIVAAGRGPASRGGDA